MEIERGQSMEAQYKETNNTKYERYMYVWGIKREEVYLFGIPLLYLSIANYYLSVSEPIQAECFSLIIQNRG